MLRISYFVGASILASILFVSSVARAEFQPTTYEARRAANPPTIDGRIDDAVWNVAQAIDRFYIYQSGGTPAASAGVMRVLWDDQFLYLGMEMDDSNIVPSSVTKGISGRDAALYEGDVIEFFVKESASSPKYFEFEWSPTGDEFDARFDLIPFGAPGTGFDTAMTSAVVVNGTIDNQNDVDEGWSVEAAIPLSAFDPIAVGSDWSFTFARYDYSPRSPSGFRSDLMMSTPGDMDAPNGGVIRGFHTYEIYDRLEFVPEPSGASGLVFIRIALVCGLAKRRTNVVNHLRC